MAEARIVPANKNVLGRPCRNCGLPLGEDVVSHREAHHYCLTCGLILGHVTRDQVLAYYADGNAGTVDAYSLDGFFSRFVAEWPAV